jgi:hypothetical protein
LPVKATAMPSTANPPPGKAGRANEEIALHRRVRTEEPMVRSIAAAAFLGLVVALFSIGSAEAGKGWCRSDPVVSIAGVSYHIEVAVHFPDDGSGQATGPVNFDIYYDASQTAEVVATDGGFDGQGETVALHPVANLPHAYALVTVPADGHYVAREYVDGDLRNTSYTNVTEYFAIN